MRQNYGARDTPAVGLFGSAKEESKEAANYL